MTSLTATDFTGAGVEPEHGSYYRTIIALLDTIQLEVVSDRLWRVCNRHVGVGANRFMAFIDDEGRGFVVTQFTSSFQRETFSTLWDALVHILRTHGLETPTDQGALWDQ